MITWLHLLHFAGASQSDGQFTDPHSYSQLSANSHFSNMMTASDMRTMVHCNYMQGDDGIPFQHTKIDGKDVVLTTDLPAVKHVLSNPDDFPHSSRSHPKVSRILNALSSTFLLHLNGPQWKLYREVLHNSFAGFNRSAVFKEVSDTMCELIVEPNVEKHLDVVDMFQRVAMDAMGKSLLGFELNTLTGESTMLKDYRRFNSQIGILSRFYPEFMVKQVIANIKRFKKHLSRQFDAYSLKQHPDDKLMLTVLKRAVVEETISRSEAIDLMTFMFVAGQETTAATLSSLTYHFAKHPEFQERARQEILEGKTDFLKRCIKETLRLTPPSFVLQARDSVSSKNGLPENTSVWMLTYAMNHSARYWQKPESFNPDRFLDPENNNLDAWMPFGVGARACPGQTYALKEIEEVMKILLSRYSIHMPSNSPHRDYLRAPVHNIIVPKDLKLVFHRLNSDYSVNIKAIVPPLPINQVAFVLIFVLLSVLYVAFMSAFI